MSDTVSGEFYGAASQQRNRRSFAASNVCVIHWVERG
jgi:hypothetical protein